MSTHEIVREPEAVEGSSNRSFGFVFTIVFLIIGLWPLQQGGDPRMWALFIAGLFLVTALFVPVVLTSLNKAWTQLGLLMHKVVNPIVLGFMFFIVITPIGLLKRVFSSDDLGFSFDPRAESYWIKRNPPGPDPKTMKDQF